jgi:hypothetical protein
MDGWMIELVIQKEANSVLPLSAPGGIAAATRELRPVELVGLYEGQREALESELAVVRAEAKLLAGQLRDTQNQLMLKDRATAAAVKGRQVGKQAPSKAVNSFLLLLCSWWKGCTEGFGL